MDKHCYNCGAEVREKTRFCSECGADLIHIDAAKQNPQNKINTSPRAYPALRFISGFFSFFGWVIILLGWLLAITAGSVISEQIKTNLPYMSLAISAIFGVMFTAFGLSFIASGELFRLLLDIGSDVRAIREK